MIKQMVERFLMWRFPKDTSPDGGITIQFGGHGPSGTNLLNYNQAEAMVKHMLEGMSQAQIDIFEERRRQINEEGWTTEHDDQHVWGELAAAAACYAAFSLHQDPPYYWPWSPQWWKPSNDERRNLVKAGALILAEIERLDRLENKND